MSDDARSRIVGAAEVAPSDLTPHPENFRKHPAEQMAALRGSLDDLGWIRSILVNKRTGHIIDGHARAEEARARGLKSVPVEYVDLSPEEERAALAVLDPLTGMAVNDQDALDALVKQVIADGVLDDADLRKMLDDLSSEEIVTVLEGEEDAAPKIPVDPVTQTGDVIILGDHVLVCGDAADPLVWDKLMGTTKAQLLWTDPPYGVSIGIDDPEEAKRRRRRTDGLKVENDDLTPEKLTHFLREIVFLALTNLEPGAATYIAGPSSGAPMASFATVLTEADLWRSTIVWAKDRFTLSRQDYHHRWEPIFYGWNPGAGRIHPLDDRTQDDVWEIPRPAASDIHPTMKPVALVERALVNSSAKGELVVDCFGGSGTTLIACEKLGRKARVIEKDPRYCDAIVTRWQEATKRVAQRPSNTKPS